MALFSIDNVRLAGVAACVPSNRESNYDFNLVNDSEKELLIKTTGIENRRVAKKGMATSDLCEKAAQKLISDLKWDKNEINLLIFISQSRDYHLPSTSIILQDKLGLPKTCMAFDIGLGCSGFTHGLSIATSLMKTSGIQRALLMTGDISTVSLSHEDKSTYPLFGDAGAVSAIELTNNSNPWYFSTNSDGSGFESIIIKDGGVRHPINEDTYTMVEVEKGIKRSRKNLWLNGLEVFSFSTREVPLSINELFAYSKTSKENIDFFIMHQANLLMNETIRKKIKIEAEKVPYSLKEFGNTSSASIPLTMVTQLKNKLDGSTQKKLLLSGFGVGLSWSNVILNTENLIIPDLIEI